jgi:Cu-Zn family superoxide dismutase
MDKMIIKRILTQFLFAFCNIFLIHEVLANSITVPMYLTAQTDRGAYVGEIILTDTQYGLLLTPNLYNLPMGEHGFHVHVHPNCGQKGNAAGSHFDPKGTNKHLGPYNNRGHLGDLPVLFVSSSGKATTPVLAPRLSVNDIKAHTLMIHVGGDNYSDYPETLGGGGARLACGIYETL